MALPSGYTLVPASDEKEKQPQKVTLPAGFSLVEPEAKPAKPAEAPKVQLPEGFSLVDSAPQAPSDTNIFGERNVEGIMGVPSVKGPIAPLSSNDTAAGAFGQGLYNVGADAALLKGKITGDTEEAEKRAAELRAAGERTYIPTDKSFTEAPLEKTTELLFGSLPYMVAPAAAAMAAPALGSAPITVPLAAGATSLLQFAGSNLARQMENNKKLEDTNLLTAGLTAIPQAALDIYGFRLIPGIRNIFGKAGMDISESVAEQLAKKSLLTKAGEYALGTGKIMGLEGATETGQQLLERLQAGLSITDEGARKEYFDSFVGGAVLGGALAVPGSAAEYAINKFADTPERAAEEAKQSALEAWKTKGLTANLPKRESYDTLVTKYTSLGQTTENAKRLADQDIADQKEAEDVERIKRETVGAGVPIPGERGLEPTERVEEGVGPTMVGPGSIVGEPETRAVVEQPALEPIALVQTMRESGRTFKNPSQVKNFLLETTPEIAQVAAQSPTIYKDLLTQWKTAPVEAPLEAPAAETVQPQEVLPVSETAPIEAPMEIAAPEAVQAQEVVTEQPITEAVEQDETLPHVVEAKKIAAQLRRLDPYNDYIDTLNDPGVTLEDVAQGRNVLAEYRPAAVAAPQPIAPDEESASINLITSAAKDLLPPQQLKTNPPVVVNDYADLTGLVSDDIKQQAEQGGVKAFVDPSTNKAYYIAGQIPKNQIRGTILHEQGGHIGLSNLVGVPRVGKLSNQVLTWAKGGNALENVIAKEAVGMANVSGEEPDSERYQQEVVAYFTEIAVNRYGIDPFKKQPKEKQKVVAWLKELWRGVLASLRKLNVDPSTLTAEDIVTLVQGAARVGTSKLNKAESKAVFTPETIALLTNLIADSPAVTKEIYETDELGKKPKILASAKDLNASLGFTKPGIDKTFTEMFYDEIKTMPEFKAGDKEGALDAFAYEMFSNPSKPVDAKVSIERVLAQLPPLTLYSLNTSDYKIKNIYRNPGEAAIRYSENANSYRKDFFSASLRALQLQRQDSILYSDLENATSEEEKIEAYHSYIKGMALIEYALAKYAMAGNKLLPITEKNEYLPLNGEDITLEFIDFMSDRLKTGATPKQALNDAFMTTIFPQRNGIIKSQVGQSETGWLFFSGVDSASALRLVTADTGSEPGSWCTGRSSSHGRGYLQNNNLSVYVQNGKSLVASLDDLSNGQPKQWFGLGGGQAVLPSHKYLLKEHPNLIQEPAVVLSPEEQLEADKKETKINEKKEGYALAERVISEAAKGDVAALSLIHDVNSFRYDSSPVTEALFDALYSSSDIEAIERITGYSPEMFEAFHMVKDETDQTINNLTVSDVVPELDALKEYNGNIRFEVPAVRISSLVNPNDPDTKATLTPISKLINAYSLENELPLRGNINAIVTGYVNNLGVYSTGSGYSNSFYRRIENLIDSAASMRREKLKTVLKHAGTLSEDEISQRISDVKGKFDSDKDTAFEQLRDWTRTLNDEILQADFFPSITPAGVYEIQLSYHMPGHPSAYGTNDDYSVSDIVDTIKYQNNIPRTKALSSLRWDKEKEIKKASKYEFIARARATLPLEKLKAKPKNFVEVIENVPYDMAGISAMLEGRETTDGEAPRILASKSKKVDSILLKIQRSESPEEMGGLLSKLMEADSWAGKKRVLNTIWNTLDSKSIATLLPALTTSQITDWVGDKIPHLNQVNRLVERMAVTRSKMLAAIDDTVKPWADYAKAHTSGGRLLSRLMHYSTLAEVDPSLHTTATIAISRDSQLAELRKLMDAASNPRAKAAYKGQITLRTNRITTAYKLWNEAGRVGKGEAHGIFTKVRDHYRAMFNLHRAILDERIAKSSISGDVDNESTPKGMLMAAIRKTYEDAKKVGVYFPLMRYGSYWMSLGKGVNKEFYMFESELQRNMFIDERIEQLQKAGDNRTYDEILESGEFDAGNDLTKLRNLTTEASEMLQGIFKIIDTQNVTDKEALKDAVYQMYLLTMPEQSFRKQFIHRKGTTGFSGDSLRNFVRSGYASANQLPRLQFGPDITTEMDSAHASLEGMPPKDKIKLSQFLNEVGTRVGEELAPSNEDEFWTRFANGVNQAAFFYRLTAIKSAIANMTAIPIFGYPVLASRYGEVKAAAALAKYTKVFNYTTFVKPDGSYTPLSIGFSKHVQSTPILAAAFEEAAERGITEITRTYDLMAMARTPSATHQGAISRGTRAFVNFAGLLFHHSERLNREIMFMTSFELAYKKGLSEGLSSGKNGEAFTRAIDESVKNTYDSMFNYTKYNRPRIMRSPPARIVFQFKLFPQQVTAYLLRNFLTMVKGSDLNPRARREATTQLVGTLMMTGMFAGVVGMPLYSMVIAVTEGIRNALRDDDDPIPIEERDLDLWFRNVWLPKHFGEAASFFEKGPISTITNADIASSTSLNNLWFRDTKYDHSLANQFSDFIIGMAGPGASLVTDGFKAYDDFKSGHFNQGVEKLLPAFAKGAFTQWAWGQEGIRVKGSQAEIYTKEEVTNMMRLWKAFGFNPTELTRIQESNYPAMELIRRAEDERNSIMNRLDLELVHEDDEAFEDALIRASRFTDANPEMAIMPDTIVNSALKRAKLRAMADRGLIVPPKLMPRMYDFIHASRPNTDKVLEQEKFDALVEAADAIPEEE